MTDDARVPPSFNDAYFDLVLRKLGTGDATPSEQQDMALRIETILIQLAQGPKIQFVHVPPLEHPGILDD